MKDGLNRIANVAEEFSDCRQRSRAGKFFQLGDDPARHAIRQPKAAAPAQLAPVENELGRSRSKESDQMVRGFDKVEGLNRRRRVHDDEIEASSLIQGQELLERRI